jgi:hypothetical protein
LLHATPISSPGLDRAMSLGHVALLILALTGLGAMVALTIG